MSIEIKSKNALNIEGHQLYPPRTRQEKRKVKPKVVCLLFSLEHALVMILKVLGV